MIEIIQGDCREVLAGRAAESVQCVVTSPPYWGLRNYGLPPLLWGDGWLGSLGLEPSPELYVSHIVETFRAVKRVLRKDGTVWLNMGDSYASGKGTCFNPGGGENSLGKERKEAGVHPLDRGNVSTLQMSGLKPKDLCGMPWRVAFALQADGWWLRSDIIWAKPNPMPESCTDRPTSSYEHVFLLAKSKSYYYDADAIREPQSTSTLERLKHPNPGWRGKKSAICTAKSSFGPARIESAGRNRRDVWTIATQPFPEAHFATFPEKLVRPCVLAGSSPRACGVCGAPWERVTELTGEYKALLDSGKAWRDDTGKPNGFTNRHPKGHPSNVPQKNKTTGWRPTCKCVHDIADIACPEQAITGERLLKVVDACAKHIGMKRCIVIDPFSGAGTVGLVCKRLGRDFVGIELSESYVAMARKRLAQPITKELFI